MRFTSSRCRVMIAVASFSVIVFAGNARATIEDLCVGGSATSTMTTDPTLVFPPEDGALYPLGRIQEGDTTAMSTLSCPTEQENLAMRLRAYLLLPGGPNWLTCFTILDPSSELTAVLGVLAAPVCATVDQSAIGTLAKVPWRGAPSAPSALSANLNTGNRLTGTCVNCDDLELARVMPKLNGTNNHLLGFAISTTYATAANNGITLPPRETLTSLLGPFTPPGIYHIETAFGQIPDPIPTCPASFTAPQCNTALMAADDGFPCPSNAAACTTAGIENTADTPCPLTATQCATFNNTSLAAGWASEDWVHGTVYGEWIVPGAKVCLPPPDGDPEAEPPAFCEDLTPVPFPGCDGTTHSEDGCLTKLLPSSGLAECVEDPVTGEEVCPALPICVADPNDPEGEPLFCLPPDLDVGCVEDPTTGEEICLPDLGGGEPGEPNCVLLPFLGEVCLS